MNGEQASLDGIVPDSLPCVGMIEGSTQETLHTAYWISSIVNQVLLGRQTNCLKQQDNDKYPITHTQATSYIWQVINIAKLQIILF